MGIQTKTPRKLVRRKWLGGLHASDRWAASFSTDKLASRGHRCRQPRLDHARNSIISEH